LPTAASGESAKTQAFRAARLVPLVRSKAAVPLQEYDEGVNLKIDLDREEDGRWIAEVLSFQA
jgi:hypothetical protein